MAQYAGEESEGYNKFTPTKSNTYYTFLFYDWGKQEIIVRNANEANRDLFVLPFNEKLLTIGAFALRCKINECHIKITDSLMRRTDEEDLKRRQLFDRAFKQRVEGREFKLKISQIVCIRNEVDAIVELYYMPSTSLSLSINDSGKKTALLVNCVKTIAIELGLNSTESKQGYNSDSDDNDDTKIDEDMNENEIDYRSIVEKFKVFES